jgi:hypothetical protein
MQRNRKKVVLMFATAAAAGFGGCAGSSKKRPAVPVARNEGELNPPTVISSTPARDARALAKAEDQLTETDWRVLEKLGPRPIWQQVDSKSRASRAEIVGVIPAKHHNYESSITNAHDMAARALPTMTPLGKPSQPTTAPTTQPTTQPTGPIPQPLIDVAELPVQIIPLGGNKLRMIWSLRNYGGTTVDSPRNGGTTRREVKLAQPDLAPLVAVLTQQVGSSGTVTALPRENTLVVTCDESLRNQTLDLLRRLDVAPRQVEITAKIFEVTHDFDFQQGANIVLNRLASDGAQSAISTFSAKRFAEAAAAGAATPVNGSVLHLMQSFADAGLSVDVTFQLLSEAGLIKVVSSPRMTVAVGQTGYMLAGQELPIQSANLVNNIVQTTTTYKPVGVQLYITPQAVSADSVKLHTISIVSSVNGFSPLPTMSGSQEVAGFVNPIIDSREAETQVTIHDGDTLVISGLRMVRSTSREEKIPGLGDMPGLGWMFKNQRTQQQLTDLYFFVTPQLL